MAEKLNAAEPETGKTRAGAIPGSGSREAVLTLADRHGFVCHVGQDWRPKPGRGFHPDGSELPVRLGPGRHEPAGSPALPARFQRRAA